MKKLSLLLLAFLIGTGNVSASATENPTNAKVYTDHYYPETLFPEMNEYTLELTVRGSDISSVTVEGPNVSLTSLEYTESMSGEWRWTISVGLPGKPSVGDAYVFHVTYNNLTTEDLTASVTGVIEEFPTIISPVHGSTITTTTPTFEWSPLSIELRSFSIMVIGPEGNFLWSPEDLNDSTSVIYNFDGEGEELQSGEKYFWGIFFSDENDDSHGFVFSEFTIGKETGFEKNNKPLAFNLSQNSPNPFNPSTTIEYSLPQDSQVNLTIYNISGQLVSVIKDELQQAGNYSITWNATGMPSGLYFCILRANGFTQTRKMVLVK